MEPLASISPTLLRPAAGAGGDLGSQLQVGRILVGEVAQRLDGGTFLLHVAGQQVPAETSVELEPGDRFLMQVERHGSGYALRILPGSEGHARSAVVDAARRLLADERPLGTVLAELGAALRAELGQREDPALRALLAAVEGRRFDPEGGVEALRALLASDRQAWPAALAAALAELGADRFDAALRALALELRSVLVAFGDVAGELTHLERALGHALRGLTVAGGEGPAGLAARLARSLGRELTALGAPRLGAEVGGAGAALFRGREGALLRALLQTPAALGGRSETARALGARALAGLEGDLRGKLAAALVELDAGGVRDAAARALAGLDLEELLNSMRRQAGEAFHVSLPVPDGDGWATAHLLWLEREQQPEGSPLPMGEEAGGAHEGASYRVVVGIELTRLGKVRADLLVRGDALAARVRASTPSTAALLRERRAELEALFGQEGRRVTLTVLDGSDAEVSVEHLAHDVRFLREHHMMDVQG